MKKFRCMMDMLLAACLLFSFHASTRGEEPATAFTYQGRLNDGDGPANGSYDLTFALFSVGSGAGQVGSTLTNAATLVSNGLFAVTLDFGDQFPGANRWLEIGVRPEGGDAFATLAPRQALTASPYALYAPNAGTAATASSVPAANLTGTVPLVQLPGEVVINNETGVTLSGTFTGNGAGLTTLNASNLGSGTVPSARLSGTYSSALTLNNAANSFTGNGAGLTTLNASNLGSGTVADARLSGNVALLNRPNQAFTGGINSFSGNVGIGTATPQTKLQVNGGDLTVSAGGNTSGAGGGINFGIAFLSTSSPMSKVQGLLANATGTELQGGLGFFTRPVASAGQSLTERVRITHDGKVGIGTTTPAGQLEVYGPISILEAVDQQQTSGTGATSAGWQSFTAGQSGLLSKVSIRAVGSPVGGGGSSLVTMKIYAGEGVGGTLLATTTLTIPDAVGWYQFTFQNPAEVQSGTQYTYKLEVSGPASVAWHALSTSNPYPGGRQQSNAAWDYNFQTYVVPSGTMLTVRDGNVGIGTTTPTQAKLVVSGVGGVDTIGDHSSFVAGGVLPPASGTFNMNDVSIKATHGVHAAYYRAVSDARIKIIKGRSDGPTDLAMLTGLEITDYTHKDVIGHGNRPQKKVIAQQVEEVFPQAVSKSTDVVPDIYQQAGQKDGWVQLATDLKVGDRVKLIGAKEEGIHEVLEVKAGAFRTAFKPATDKVFVYGREVKDFHSVDYDAIAMLNVSATQELARQLAAKDGEISKLQTQVSQLEQNLAAVQKLVTQLAETK